MSSLKTFSEFWGKKHSEIPAYVTYLGNIKGRKAMAHSLLPSDREFKCDFSSLAFSG